MLLTLFEPKWRTRPRRLVLSDVGHMNRPCKRLCQNCISKIEKYMTIVNMN